MSTSKLVLFAALLAPGAGLAATTLQLDRANVDIHDTASLQRGASNFVTYCLACHAAKYVRWNRVAADLDIEAETLEQYLAPSGSKPHDTISSLMPADQAVAMLGVEPPDLSLIARSRGVDYLYTFLRSYYSDTARRSGTNNLVLPYTAMPHVLAGLQGMPQPKVVDAVQAGKSVKRVVGTVEGTPGTMTKAEFDGFVRDTVNFLDYIGEPIKAKRQSMGVWVVVSALVFWLMTYLLKREYWKGLRGTRTGPHD